MTITVLGRTCGLTFLFSGLLLGCSSPSTSPAATAPQPTVKTSVKGLVTMGSTEFQQFGAGTPDNSLGELNAHPNIYVASVINVTWAQLEPAQGTFDFSSIDNTLGLIATYNGNNPAHPVVGKLRVWAGPNTPAWAVTLSGGPVTVQGHNVPVQFPSFWTTAYRSAWVPLQAALAARYDGNAMVNQVTITSCSQQTFEPFIRPLDAMSVTNMLAAGYTDAQDATCLQNAASDYAAWKLTPLEFPFSPLPHIDGGKVSVETTTPISLMTSLRSSMGTRLVVANEGLDVTFNSALAQLYTAFPTVGPPLQFQTYNPFVNWDQTIAIGITYHPSQIEIWDTTAAPKGQAVLTTAQLQSYAAMVAAD